MLVQKLGFFFRNQSLQRILHFILAASSGSLIFWSTMQLFQHQCSVTLNISNLAQKCSQFPWDFIPIFIGFVFGMVGLAGWHYQWETVVLQFFFVSCDMLVTGFVSGLGTDLGIRLFYVFLSLLAPSIYHFHAYWLKIKPNKLEITLDRIISFLSLICIIPFIIWQNHSLELLGIAQPVKNLIRSLVLFSAASTVLLIVITYRKDTAFVFRSRVRLVFSGIVFAIAPLVFLNILPRLVSSYYIPAEFNLPWLLIIPLSYWYSILRPSMVKSETIIFRAMLYFLFAILVLSISLLVSAIINRFHGWNQAWLFFGLMLTALGLWIYLPIRQGLGRFAMWVLYGDRNQYIYVLEEISQALVQVIERRSLGELLVTKLMQSMPISGAALLLANFYDCLSVQSFTGLVVPTFLSSRPTGNALQKLDFFTEKGFPIDQADLLKSGWFHSLPKADQNQICGSGIALWVPLVFNGRLLGLLLLGNKINEDFFTMEDRRIIGILAHQAGITSYNILLMEDVQEGQKELAKANQQLLTAQDKEQSRLARDLHDVVIQQLLGLSYQSLEIREKLGKEHLSKESVFEAQNDLKSLQESLLEVVSRLRSVIRDLRPVGLEELGLPEALEGYLSLMRRDIDSGGPNIEWDLEKTNEPIAFSVKINLFRITQEAVKNAICHAKAKYIKVQLHFTEDTGTLEVIDDGIGFIIPDRLSHFAQSNHFGLIGIYERASCIDGQLSVESPDHQGTRISIHFQL